MKKLLLLLALVCTVSVSAQTTIKMKTLKEIGDEFSFAVNAGLKCFVDWGNGKNDTIISTTDPITGTLTGKTVTLKTNYPTFFDCSGQQINQITFAGAASIEALIISDNKIMNCTISAMTNLRTLWCDHNTLTSLDFSTCPKLESFLGNVNYIRTVNKPAGNFTELTDFWIGNNRVTSLDLFGSTKLKTLNVENNKMESMKLSTLEEKALAVFIDGNSLDFTSFWNKINAQQWHGTTQTIDFPQSKYQMGEEFTLDRNLLGRNQDGTEIQAMSFTYSWYPYMFGVKGEKLVRGNPGVATADYSTPNTLDKKHIFTFNRAFDDIQLEIKHNKYIGFTILTNHIEIEDPTGIKNQETNTAEDSGLKITPDGSGVMLQTSKPTKVTIRTLDGACCWQGTILNATRIPLAKGVYLINNHKISL